MDTFAGQKPERALPSIAESIGMITPTVVNQFHQEGVVILRNALHREWLRLIEMALERVVNTGTPRVNFYENEPSGFFETVRNFAYVPEIQRLLFDSPIADMMSVAIESENIWLFSDELFIKGGGAARTPWHQDSPYFSMAGEQVASMWITLDPLPKEECLEYIPGSHKQVLYDGFDPSFVKYDKVNPVDEMRRSTEELPPLPDIDADRDKWNPVSWEIVPGDVILSHPAIIHGGGPTAEGGRRRALAVRCYGDDVVYAEPRASRGTTSRTPGLSLQLRVGDLLRHPWYPRLRPRPQDQCVG